MGLAISRGKVAKAQKVVVYGPEGVGKTVFASRFPRPLFIDTEGSTEHYDVERTQRPASWAVLMAQVQAVKAERPCQTLVIDTADWAERLCSESVCARHKVGGIEDFGWGKGYTYLAEEFGKLLNLLSDVTDAGINVVVTAHAAMRKFEQPDEAAAYDRWELKLQKKTAAMLKEWADAILFANYETIVEVVGEGKSAHGKARGNRRVMHAEHNACWDAKNRWGLPGKVPFEYEQIAQFVPAGIAPAGQNQPKDVAPAMSSAPSHEPALPAEAPRPQTVAPKPIQTIVYNQGGSVASNVVHAREADASTAAPGGLPGYFGPLLQILGQEGMTLDEVKAVAVRKGHFTADTPIERFDEAYVSGFVLSNWHAFAKEILDARPVPFN